MTFQVRVCGAENITMLEYNPKIYRTLMLWVDPANSSVVDQYVTIDQATFARWFRLEPINDPCYIKDYNLHSHWTYDKHSKYLAHAPFNFTQQAVTWHGSMGSYELRLHKTIKNTWVDFFLGAETRGKVRSSREF